MDSGIAAHTDLNGNYSNEDAFDFYDTTTNIPILSKNDEDSHGTHVAGIIGAEGNNGIGISGINWDISLVQLRSLYAPSSTRAIINAINYATNLWNTNEKIHILSFSIGMGGNYSEVETAIRAFCEKGGLFICSTGNKPQDNDSIHHYPSYYASDSYENKIPNMISVGRIDINDDRPASANWGENAILIYAPGQNILSTTPTQLCTEGNYYVNSHNGVRLACECEYKLYEGTYQWVHTSTHKANGYHYMSGSSMSTPHVSGVAALLLSVNPSLTAAQIKECILGGAENITITTGSGEEQEVKKLNAFGAFRYLMDNYPDNTSAIGIEDSSHSDYVDASSEYFVNNTYMQELNVSDPGEYTFTVSASNAIELKFYDTNLNEITISQVKSNGDKQIEFTYNLSKSTYYIRVEFTSGTATGNINIAVDAPVHVHEYLGWLYKNDTTHYQKCVDCHHEETGAHVVKVNTVVNNVGRCLLCNGLVNFDNGFGQIIHNVQKVSINGSYILSNGIIVLVDEDVEAYLNGTLVFYDKDKLPELQ